VVGEEEGSKRINGGLYKGERGWGIVGDFGRRCYEALRHERECGREMRGGWGECWEVELGGGGG